MSVHPSVLVTEFLYPTPPLKYNRWVQCMALVSETKEGGICSDSENFVTPVCASQEICLGPISLFHVFGLWRTAWKLAKTGDDVRMVGRYVRNHSPVPWGMWALLEGINHLTNVYLLQMLALYLLMSVTCYCKWVYRHQLFLFFSMRARSHL